MPLLRPISDSTVVPNDTLLEPSAKPLPYRYSVPPLYAWLADISSPSSVGTTCSRMPVFSRARRTMPVVAAAGTTTVRLVPSAATASGVASVAE